MIKHMPVSFIKLTNAGKDHPAVGEKFFSKYLDSTITVSRVFDDANWLFTMERDGNTEEWRAQTALSFFQRKKVPNYSETRRRAVTKHRAELNAMYERAANECMAGIHLNGEQRRESLSQTGFSGAQIAIIQSIVNRKIKEKTNSNL